MDPVVLSALILALGAVLGALLGNYAGRRRRPEHYRKLESAMDDLLHLLRDSLKEPEGNQTAMSLFHRLRQNHSLNFIVAGFYLLRERGIIHWEKDNILKPKHKISLVVR